MSEVNLFKESERGNQAQHWLDDPMTKEAFETVRQGILQEWAKSPVIDKEGQHTLRLMLKLLDDVHANIQQVALTGELARIQIKAEKERATLAQRAKQFFERTGVRV